MASGFFDRPNWNEGKSLNIALDKNTCVVYTIKPQKTKYLKEMGKCQEESYYDCISSQIDGLTEFNKCSRKCIPNAFSSIGGKNYSTAFCLNDTSNQQCIAKQILNQVGSKCKKSCSTLEYFGAIEINTPYGKIYQSKWNVNSNWNAYMVCYKFNVGAKLYEEYLICDTMGMIGSVGGTIGLFI